MKLIIDIPEKDYNNIQPFLKGQKIEGGFNLFKALEIIKNGIPLTPYILADALMEERIRGKLKQDVSFSKDVIDDVRCKLTVDIIDHRPCYCGAELREVWRESEEVWNLFGDIDASVEYEVMGYEEVNADADSD